MNEYELRKLYAHVDYHDDQLEARIDYLQAENEFLKRQIRRLEEIMLSYQHGLIQVVEHLGGEVEKQRVEIEREMTVFYEGPAH